ncbi:F0F1 ATP synthase subunit A [Weeksella virosa]|uniref:ATP synthase subunit a n=1 Tax=Weeksella virosa (strain ATCC 43766 / DSM 16922 / JCM 21250 / CCUG 30538 / CDC 9751 / IAM 14551 / NBRC 16016 / NCTC 11634 / CL345/78) TaxID=865938 RepID=F0P2Z7_WEEVC|nr:F0F1 ATP synthase subunit A [Weeksella virosa]ADX67909.1 ATP synthase subunit a [Weeksella virosa DSM 16922]MDK7674515.1 F0F1 ATP synthase subunit A [Weeksella virosa]SUP54212.1 F-ATPase subunit 6 [Weeksella virosa]VEH64464.1 F-ATPase subunit 6 [Weeksella virosa]
MKFSTLFILLFFFVFSFTKAEDVSVIQPSESTFQELVAKEKKAYAEEAAKVKTGESKYNPVPVIMSHLADGHDWHFWGEGENSFTIPLPVILWDNGLKIFMSSKFHHNEEVAEVDGVHYFNYNEKIYKTDAQGTVTFEPNEKGEMKIANEMPLDFSITKNVASMLLSVVIMILLFGAVAANYKKQGKEGYVPRGVAGFIEPIIIFIRDEVAIPNIGEKKYARYMPYLLTLFFFIWINNLLGLLPGAANLTGNIAVTLVLAVIALIVINVSGNKHYWGHMLWMPGVPVPVKLILAPIELVGILTKPFALMIRLFANITAGHIIIMSLISIIFIFQTEAVALGALPLTLFIDFLELLVAVLQAFIFTMLVSLFIGAAVADPEEGH